MKVGASMANLLIEKHFRAHFGDSEAAPRVVRAPGRVNVIGEHTDYNDGFVFPAAIDKYITIAGTARPDRTVRAYSVDYDEEVSFSLEVLERNPAHPWANYLIGVIRFLGELGISLRGMNLAVSGTVPQGAGLSSSAALEMATAYMVQTLHGTALDPRELIRLCQRAENEFIGVNCGIMDQYISCLGKKGHALLLDCRSLDSRPIPLLPAGVKLVVANTRVKHSLAASAYNERRRECEEAAARLEKILAKPIKTLRDITLDEFEQVSAALPEVVRRRAEHVLRENRRVLEGVQALEEGDLAGFGVRMYQSHHSLRMHYEVSCPELDWLVQFARQVEGVYGSRMTGGGFGGCTVSLVRAEAVESLITYLAEKYGKKTGITPEFYICDAVDGAEAVNPLK